MGYYTRHELEIKKGEDYSIDYEEEIGECSEYGSCVFSEEIKWYNHEEYMREYSKKHPQVVFALKGIGEEEGDIWIEYYKNGLMQRENAKITFGEYSERLLT